MNPVTAIVLAGGLSRRAGGENKLLAPWNGRTVLVQCVRTALGAGFAGVVVVLGHEEDRVRQALSAQADRVEFAWNERYGEGMGTGIAAGVSASPEGHGVAVLMGDMPHLPLRHLADLRAAYAAAPAPAIVASGDGRRVGCPAIFDPAYRPHLLALRGDEGARSILRAHAERVVEVQAADPRWLEDVDAP